MRPQNFEDQGFNRTPPWLGGTWAAKFLTVAYGLFDLVNRSNLDAAKSGLVETCPVDAVPYHARARMIDAILGETVEALRLRLLSAWSHWSESGTKAGLQAKLREYLPEAPDLVVYDIANDDWTGGAVLDGYDDDNGDNSSRLMVVIPQSHPWDTELVGPGLVVGPELLVGISMPASRLAVIRSVFRKYRPAHCIGIGIDVLLDTTTAADHLADHDVTNRLARLPLHRALVGYQQHGLTVGPHLVVGQEFV